MEPVPQPGPGQGPPRTFRPPLPRPSQRLPPRGPRIPGFCICGGGAMSRKKKGKARNGEMGEKDGPKSSGLGDIKKVIGLLTARERRSLVYVILGATFMAIIEVAGIGSIGPF